MLRSAIRVTKVRTPCPHHPVPPCLSTRSLSPCPHPGSCPGSGGLPGLGTPFLTRVAARLAALRSPYRAKRVLVQFSLPH